MKISKSLLAAMALTIGASLFLTSCDPEDDDDLTTKTEEECHKNNEKGNPDAEPCPACGMG